jgi:hypothetical protein
MLGADVAGTAHVEARRVGNDRQAHLRIMRRDPLMRLLRAVGVDDDDFGFQLAGKRRERALQLFEAPLAAGDDGQPGLSHPVRAP